MRHVLRGLAQRVHARPVAVGAGARGGADTRRHAGRQRGHQVGHAGVVEEAHVRDEVAVHRHLAEHGVVEAARPDVLVGVVGELHAQRLHRDGVDAEDVAGVGGGAVRPRLGRVDVHGHRVARVAVRHDLAVRRVDEGVDDGLCEVRVFFGGVVLDHAGVDAALGRVGVHDLVVQPGALAAVQIILDGFPLGPHHRQRRHVRREPLSKIRLLRRGP